MVITTNIVTHQCSVASWLLFSSDRQDSNIRLPLFMVHQLVFQPELISSFVS